MNRWPSRLRLRERDGDEELLDLGAADGHLARVRPRGRPAPSLPSRSLGARLREPLALAGIACVVIALGAYLLVYESGRKTTAVLVASQSLPAGTVVSAGDLRSARLAGDRSVLSTLVPENEESQIIGRRLTAAVPAGAPLPAGAVASGASQTSAFVLFVPELDVMDGGITPGARVGVLATFGAGSGQAQTRAVARNLEVLSVGEAPAGSDPGATTVPVSVALSNPSLSSSLALANEDAKVDLMTEGQTTSTAPIAPASQGALP